MALFEAILKQIQGTWQKYTVALSILVMSFIIDGLSGFKFLHDTQEIQLAGFKVVRESISVAFGLLFSVFVVAAFYQSENLKRSSQALTEANAEALRNMPGLQLWLSSPFSPSRFLRWVFWGVFVSGYLWLAWFSLVHLLAYGQLASQPHGPWLFRSIGVFDLALFCVCVKLGWLLYWNFEDVRVKLLAAMKGGQACV